MSSLEKLVLGTLLLIPIGFAGGLGYALMHIQPPKVTINTPGPVIYVPTVIYQNVYKPTPPTVTTLNPYAGWTGIPGIIAIAPGVKVNCIAVDTNKKAVTPNPSQQCLTEMIAATRK